MADAPSWLTESPSNSAPTKVANPAASKSYVPPPIAHTVSKSSDVESQSAAAPVPVEFDIDPAVLEKIKLYHLILRALYCTTAIFLGTAAGLSLVNQSDLGKVFFAFYVFFFALLICCFETALTGAAKYIANNFGFLYTIYGRWIFLLFVGFMSYSLSTIGIAAMAWLYAVGCFHAYCVFTFPIFNEYVRSKHYHGK